MDVKTIRKLLNLISESDVNEVQIEEGDFKIQVKKQPDVIRQEAPQYQQPPASAYMMPPQEGQQAAAVPPQSQQPAAQQQQPAQQNEQPQGGQQTEPAKETRTVKSPIVGTFYRAPSPDSDPYVQVGDQVKKGDTICIVEAMKIMNEIESEYEGKVAKILVEDASPVEFDQPLFEIEPS